MNQGSASILMRSNAAIANTSPVVFIVDDDLSVRGSLEQLVRSAGWLARPFASGREFLACPRSLAPSCLVLDAKLPDFNGLELQGLLADRIELPIIFVARFVDVQIAVQAMKAGAVEFLTKPLSDREMLSAMQCALDRSRDALAEEAEMRTLTDRYAELTARERQVMGLVVTGLLNKQISGELGISEVTVKAHRGKMMRKMQASSLPELVRISVRLHIIPAVKLLTRRTIDRSSSGGSGADRHGIRLCRGEDSLAAFAARINPPRLTHRP
jgi:FixJ family two-component response regulator